MQSTLPNIDLVVVCDSGCWVLLSAVMNHRGQLCNATNNISQCAVRVGFSLHPCFTYFINGTRDWKIKPRFSASSERIQTGAWNISLFWTAVIMMLDSLGYFQYHGEEATVWSPRRPQRVLCRWTSAGIGRTRTLQGNKRTWWFEKPAAATYRIRSTLENKCVNSTP